MASLQRFLKELKKQLDSLDTQNPMNNFNKPFFWIGIVLIVFIFLMLVRSISSMGHKGDTPSKNLTFRVEVLSSQAQDKTVYYVAQAFLEAKQKTVLRAETDGLISKVYAEKGQNLRQHDPILDVAIESRLAKLREAQATVSQRQLEYNNSLALQSNAFRSKTAVADSKSKYESAKAAYESIKQEIEDTKIRAPFEGRLDYRQVQEGDYVKTGDTLGIFVNLNPMLAVINVPESILGYMKEGSKAEVSLSSQSSKILQGKISFVSHVADPMMRTFRVEVEINNDDLSLFDGLTAKVRIPIKQTRAHILSPAVLSLSDDGQVGVKMVDARGIVHFHPVSVLNHDSQGIWLDGLKDTERVIVTGQDFVTAGQKVEAVPISIKGK